MQQPETYQLEGIKPVYTKDYQGHVPGIFQGECDGLLYQNLSGDLLKQLLLLCSYPGHYVRPPRILWQKEIFH